MPIWLPMEYLLRNISVMKMYDSIRFVFSLLASVNFCCLTTLLNRYCQFHPQKHAMMDLSDNMGPYKTSTMLDLTNRKPMEVHYLFRKPVSWICRGYAQWCGRLSRTCSAQTSRLISNNTLACELLGMLNVTIAMDRLPAESHSPSFVPHRLREHKSLASQFRISRHLSLR